MRLLSALSRQMLASKFAMDGAVSLKDPESQAAQAKPLTDRAVPLLQQAAPQAPIPTDPVTWVRISGAVNIVGAALLASGRMPRLAATMLAANLVPRTIAAHSFWNEPDPNVRSEQRQQFVKDISVAGGLLMTAFGPRGTKHPKHAMRPKPTPKAAG
ncbi:MAG: DoxX family protein [Nocardioidaceae bacterium]